jgi:lipopolysaccharide/colanic/teichoic acid biosynthesis glycosyltransferase
MIRVIKHYFLQAALSLLTGRPVAKPDFTGRAQVSCSYGVFIGELRQKLRYNLCYASTCTPLHDLKGMLLMRCVVLWQKGLR